jgi:hypothetical protein
MKLGLGHLKKMHGKRKEKEMRVVGKCFLFSRKLTNSFLSDDIFTYYISSANFFNGIFFANERKHP